jgi:hypothetical protein
MSTTYKTLNGLKTGNFDSVSVGNINLSGDTDTIDGLDLIGVSSLACDELTAETLDITGTSQFEGNITQTTGVFTTPKISFGSGRIEYDKVEHEMNFYTNDTKNFSILSNGSVWASDMSSLIGATGPVGASGASGASGQVGLTGATGVFNSSDAINCNSLTVANNVLVDTNLFKIDASSNRFGFGTASPSYFVDFVQTTNPALGVVRFNNNVSAGTYSSWTTIPGISIFRYSTQNIIRMCSGVYDSNTIEFNTTTTRDASIVSKHDQSATFRYMYFCVNGNVERMRINYIGNLGVGVTDPLYKIHSSGDINVNAGSVYRIGGTQVLSSSALAVTGNVSCATLSTTSTISAGGDLSVTGNISGATLSTTSTISAGGNLTMNSKTIRLGSDDYHALRIGTASNFNSVTINGPVLHGYSQGCLGTKAGTNEKIALFWNDSQRVGIANSSPSYNLDVTGTGRFTSSVYINTLDVSGNITQQSGIASLKAITGTTLSCTSGISGLTLDVSGNITQQSGTASLKAITGTTLSCTNGISGLTLDVSGNITQQSGIATLQTVNCGSLVASGGVSTTTLSGTITTSSQPQITSLGTLSSLAVTASTTTGTLGVTNSSLLNTVYANTLSVSGNATISGTLTSSGLVQFNNSVGVGVSPTAPLHVQISSTSGDPDTRGIYCYNSNSASTSAHSVICARTNTSGGGSPYLSLDVNGVGGWSFAVDNSDSRKLKISPSWNGWGSPAISIDTSNNTTFYGNVTLGYKKLFICNQDDDNHAIRYCGSSQTFASKAIDGVCMYGNEGVILGTKSGGDKVAFRCDSSQRVGLNGNDPSTGVDLKCNYIYPQAICGKCQCGPNGASFNNTQSLFSNGFGVTFDLKSTFGSSYGWLTSGTYIGMYRPPLDGYYQINVSVRFSDWQDNCGVYLVAYDTSTFTTSNLVSASDGIVWSGQDTYNGRTMVTFSTIAYIYAFNRVYPRLYAGKNIMWAEMSLHLVSR